MSSFTSILKYTTYGTLVGAAIGLKAVNFPEERFIAQRNSLNDEKFVNDCIQNGGYIDKRGNFEVCYDNHLSYLDYFTATRDGYLIVPIGVGAILGGTVGFILGTTKTVVNCVKNIFQSFKKDIIEKEVDKVINDKALKIKVE